VRKTCTLHKDLLFVITNIPSKIKAHLRTNDKFDHSLVEAHVCSINNVICLSIKSYIKHSLQKTGVKIFCCD